MKIEDERKTEAINLKLSVADKARIVALAKAHADGNIARWIRYASLNFKPTPEDLGTKTKVMEETTHG